MSPLKRFRIDAGWTMQELATASGVGLATISAVERGAGASPRNLGKLAVCLSQKLDQAIAPSDLLLVEPTTGAAA